MQEKGSDLSEMLYSENSVSAFDEQAGLFTLVFINMYELFL